MSYSLHPREIKYDRYWARRAAATARLSPGVRGKENPSTDQPGWMDYYPWALGTVPEKMIFAELAKRQVTFFFGAFWGDSPFTEKIDRLRPDFILPEYRIIIEIYGSYWHTQADSQQRDASRTLQYIAAGYTVYNIWDWEIYAGAARALDRIPELISPAIRTGRIFVAERPFDPTASLRAQRRASPKVIRLRESATRSSRKLKAPSRTRRLRLSSPKSLPKTGSPGFGGFAAEDVSEYASYGQQWKKYIEDLNSFFNTPGSKRGNRTLYDKALRWKDWWTRWQKAMDITPEWRNYIGRLGTYFTKYPNAARRYRKEYYHWLTWRNMGFRKI